MSNPRVETFSEPEQGDLYLGGFRGTRLKMHRRAWMPVFSVVERERIARRQ